MLSTIRQVQVVSGVTAALLQPLPLYQDLHRVGGSTQSGPKPTVLRPRLPLPAVSDARSAFFGWRELDPGPYEFGRVCFGPTSPANLSTSVRSPASERSPIARARLRFSQKYRLKLQLNVRLNHFGLPQRDRGSASGRPYSSIASLAYKQDKSRPRCRPLFRPPDRAPFT